MPKDKYDVIDDAGQPELLRAIIGIVERNKPLQELDGVALDDLETVGVVSGDVFDWYRWYDELFSTSEASAQRRYEEEGNWVEDAVLNRGWFKRFQNDRDGLITQANGSDAKLFGLVKNYVKDTFDIGWAPDGTGFEDAALIVYLRLITAPSWYPEMVQRELDGWDEVFWDGDEAFTPILDDEEYDDVQVPIPVKKKEVEGG